MLLSKSDSMDDTDAGQLKYWKRMDRDSHRTEEKIMQGANGYKSLFAFHHRR